MFIVYNRQLLLDMIQKINASENKKAFIVDIKQISGKNTQDKHLSTLTFVIYRHPMAVVYKER